MLSIILGLTSALTWGAADFTGGLVSRKTGPYRAVFFGEVIGLAAILMVAVIVGEPLLTGQAWLLAMAAGMLGTTGLLLLYYSMTKGLMSIAAPVSALLAAALPVIVGTLTEGPPGLVTYLGFVLALVAIWLISQSQLGVKDILTHISDLRLPLLAGIGFGLFFVLMHAAARTGACWPIVAARLGGMLIITVYMLLRKESWGVPKGVSRLVVLNGLLDAGGNLFFILAGQLGRLDIAAVVSSLYPGSTVVLAGIILKERLSHTQWIGILAALLAIILLTL